MVMWWRWMHALPNRLRALFRPAQAERELDDELAFHLDMHARAHQRDGLSRPEAERRARIALAGVEQTKERSRDAWPLRWARDAVRDTQYAIRALRRAPGFTLVAGLTLALGTGANTALFGVVSGVLLRPLPFPEPDRLVRVWATSPRTQRGSPSLPDYRDLRERNRTFAELGAYAFAAYNAAVGDRPELLRAQMVTASMWDVLGVRPLYGHVFSSAAEQWGQHRVAVVSHGLWLRRLGGDPRAIGTTLHLDGQAYVVAAVMPASFGFGGPSTELWTPMSFPPGDIAETRSTFFIDVLGRMNPHVTVTQAHDDLLLIEQDLDQRFGMGGDLGIAMEEWQESIVGPIRPTLLLLFGAVGVLLLIACANVGNLLLVRATTREHELAVRATLGAGRGRLARQLLTEHVLLASVGAAGGIALSAALIRALPTLGPSNVPRLANVAMDGRVLAFALSLALVTGLLFGAWPARHAGRVGLIGRLNETGRGTIGGGTRARTRRVLITAELALALVLLTGAALLIVSLQRVRHVDPGLVPDHLFTARINLPRAQYRDPNRVRRFIDDVTTGIARVPGVRSAGATTTLPLGDGDWGRLLTIDGRPAPRSFAETPSTRYRIVTPDYFRALGARVVRGRAFTTEDGASAPLVSVINRTLARRLWPDQDPIGQRISVDPPEALVPQLLPLPDGSMRFPRLTIVGIIDDLRQYGLERRVEPEVFVPFAQSGDQTGVLHFLVARTIGDPIAATTAIADVVHRVDRDVPLADVRSMDDRLANSMAQRRVVMLVLGGFAALALLLAVVGTYGVMAYVVSQRRVELGVRAAMGASAGKLVRMVLGDGLRVAVLGAAIGLTLSAALSRWIASQLFQVDAIDPLLYGAATMLVVLVAAAACAVPALRAARTDPAAALREM